MLLTSSSQSHLGGESHRDPEIRRRLPYCIVTLRTQRPPPTYPSLSTTLHSILLLKPYTLDSTQTRNTSNSVTTYLAHTATRVYVNSNRKSQGSRCVIPALSAPPPSPELHAGASTALAQGKLLDNIHWISLLQLLIFSCRPLRGGRRGYWRNQAVTKLHSHPHSTYVQAVVFVDSATNAHVFSPRAQWTQDLDHSPGTSQEIRSEEDPQGDQEEVRLQWNHRSRHRNGRSYSTTR